VEARFAEVGGALIVAAATVLGCNSGEKLSVAKVPLAPGARVEAQQYGCPATPTVCFRSAILVGANGTSGRALKAAQRRILVRHGWHFREGITTRALAADSGDSRLFISFEAGSEELADGRAGRTAWGDKKIGAQLRRLVDAHAPVLAVTLEKGSAK
jgi:hypothetical protein